jgi:hypothetical protein
MLNISGHKGNANQNDIESPSHAVRMTIINNTTNDGEDARCCAAAKKSSMEVPQKKTKNRTTI